MKSYQESQITSNGVKFTFVWKKQSFGIFLTGKVLKSDLKSFFVRATKKTDALPISNCSGISPPVPEQIIISLVWTPDGTCWQLDLQSTLCNKYLPLNIRLACSTGRLRTKNPFKVANFTLTSVQGTQRVESTLFKLLLSLSPFHWVCISAPRFNYAYSH